MDRNEWGTNGVFHTTTSKPPGPLRLDELWTNNCCFTWCVKMGRLQTKQTTCEDMIASSGISQNPKATSRQQLRERVDFEFCRPLCDGSTTLDTPRISHSVDKIPYLYPKDTKVIVSFFLKKENKTTKRKLLRGEMWWTWRPPEQHQRLPPPQWDTHTHKTTTHTQPLGAGVCSSSKEQLPTLLAAQWRKATGRNGPPAATAVWNNWGKTARKEPQGLSYSPVLLMWCAR